MKPGIDPKVDYAFKWLFGNAERVRLVVDLVNAVLALPPGRRIATLDIRNPYNDKNSADDKQTILDIRARDETGQQYNIEMQMQGTWFLPHRLLYYWAQVHADQLKQGDEFRELRPTISICFVSTNIFPDVPDYHLHFELLSEEHPHLVFSAHQSMHLFQLPKLKSKVEELVGPMEAWCYFLIHGETLDTESLPDTLRTALVPEAMEALVMFSQDEVERARYLSRKMFQHDQATALAEATELGERKGLLRQIQLCQRLLKEPQASEQDLAALSNAELQALAQELEKRLTARVK